LCTPRPARVVIALKIGERTDPGGSVEGGSRLAAQDLAMFCETLACSA